jgi:hypothetical protein
VSMKSIVALIAMAGAAFASTITGASATTGTIYDAASVTDTMIGITGSASGTVTLNGLSFSLQCVFVGNNCNAGSYVLSVTGGDTNASSTIWTVNNQSMGTIDSLTVSLTGAVFNPCVSGGVPTSQSGCASSTPGAGTGGSVIGNTPDSGTTAATAVVAYSNELRLGGINGLTYGDAYTQVVLTFSNNFNTGDTFTFLADTDLAPGFGSVGTVTGNPEPATYGLVGGALVGLALLRRRRNVR